jgi:hypothetical protein
MLIPLKNLKYIFLFLFVLVWVDFLQAQGENRVIIFSGFVVDGSNSEPIPGVHLYIPKAGRGAATNAEGFFAIGVVPGDSVVVSSIGFKKHFYRVPSDKSDNYSVVIELVEDVTMLPIIEVFPYPTEEMFKEAILATRLPDEERREALKENLDQITLTRIAMTMPMDASMNFRYSAMQDAIRLGNRTSLPTLQLLNPFAWARFIQSVKRGDFKKGKWKDRK